ncbi:MAG: ATPase, T2SS/T4P/T4SS family [Candidatus Hodarchaeota archaeon]
MVHLRERTAEIRVCPDTSAIVAGVFTTWLEENLQGSKETAIFLPRPVMAEIENLANRRSTIGLNALRELRRIEEMVRLQGSSRIEVVGSRPKENELILNQNDALIREIAKEHQATLLTCDRTQADLALIEDIETIYFRRKKIPARIEDFFGDEVMSVHLKENLKPLLKVGKPGSWVLRAQGEIMGRQELDEIAGDLIERARTTPGSFIEMDKPGCSVVQLENMRIVVAKPPFSEGTEVTAVRPLVKLSFPENYVISARLLKRFDAQAEGILISGSPGAGKSTFAAALAEYYAKKNKVVKTLERPRDLQVGPHITQYTALGSMTQTADILLLVRPDFVIYDELRTTDDFRVFADMRLAGVGLVGVVHSTSAIDSIQRFLGRIDLGLIPSIVDTIVHIENGQVSSVYGIKMTVKVPWGIEERDLARPVVVVTDFETNRSLYEIYVFGEQTVVIPLKSDFRYASTGATDLTAIIQERMGKLVDSEIFVRKGPGKNLYFANVHPQDIGSVLGKKGRRLRKIEEEFGVKIDLQKRKGIHHRLSPLEIKVGRKQIIIEIQGAFGEITIQSEDENLGSFTVGRKGRIRLAKDSFEGQTLLNWINNNKTITWVNE